MKSVLIADDHPVVRAAVKILLKQEGFQQIYEVANGNEVLSMIREHQPDRWCWTWACRDSTGWMY